jgi:hypothetical protein
VAEGDLGDLAGQCGRRLLAAALPRAERTVDIVVPGDPGFQAVVLTEMASHPFGEQLLPAIAVLRVGRICVRLGEGGDVRVGLLLGVVHAG